MDKLFAKKSKGAKQTGLFGMEAKAPKEQEDEEMQITEEGAKKSEVPKFVPWVEK